MGSDLTGSTSDGAAGGESRWMSNLPRAANAGGSIAEGMIGRSEESNGGMETGDGKDFGSTFGGSPRATRSAHVGEVGKGVSELVKEVGKVCKAGSGGCG